MTDFLTFISLTLLTTISVFGQSRTTSTEIDTLMVFDDGRLFVNYIDYLDSTFSEKGQAFIYPDTITVRKSRWLPSLFKTKVKADSMILHGKIVSYGENGKYRVGRYEHGEKLEMTYFDSTHSEISATEYYSYSRPHFDPETGTNRFLIHGQKKKKE